MPYRVEYNVLSGVVETVFFGAVTMEEAQAEMLESHHLAEEHGSRLYFADLTDAVLQLSLVDIYSLPTEYETIGGARPIRVALIPPRSAEGEQVAEFYKTVGLNRGWIVETFAENQRAFEWLNRPFPERDP